MKVGCSIRDFSVRPDQEEPLGCDSVTGRNLELKLIGDGVGEEIAGQISGGGAVIVEFEPVAVLAANGVDDGVGVAGHPFVYGDAEGYAAAVVSSLRGGVKEFLTSKALAIGE